MKAHLKHIGNTDTWITPSYITKALGHFDLDPCAHTEMPWHHALRSYTIQEDGLSQDWKGRVWLNPPFNRYSIDVWFKKMAEHKNGIMLTGGAFETERFKKYVWPYATQICCLDHRPHFIYPDGSKSKINCGQTIVLIAYDEYNARLLRQSKLGWMLKPSKSIDTNDS